MYEVIINLIDPNDVVDSRLHYPVTRNIFIDVN